jgi:hypothetical protein
MSFNALGFGGRGGSTELTVAILPPYGATFG